MYDIQIKTTPESERMLKEYPEDFKEALLKGVKRAVLYAEGQAKKSFGKVGNLKARTGHLRRSIKSSVTDRYKEIVGSLYSDVIYSAIHEYGGTITAKSSPYLKFTVAGRWVQIKSVTIPARPYLGPAIEDHLKELSDIITDMISVEMNKPND
jgi:phage gpG-like protein